jgi:hypothetical protein
MERGDFLSNLLDTLQTATSRYSVLWYQARKPKLYNQRSWSKYVDVPSIPVHLPFWASLDTPWKEAVYYSILRVAFVALAWFLSFPCLLGELHFKTLYERCTFDER